MDWLGKIDSSSLMMIEIRDETAEIKNRKKIKKRNSRVGLRNPQWNTQRDRQRNMHNTFPNSYLIGWKNWFSSVANSVTYNWRNLMLFETKCMLQNSEPSERANPLARSARDSEIFGSALVSSAGSAQCQPWTGINKIGYDKDFFPLHLRCNGNQQNWLRWRLFPITFKNGNQQNWLQWRLFPITF